MNIAKRVALEIGERVGDTVGYHVGMDSRVSPRTRVIFMTTGIFLMRMVNNPESLEKYTHLIMDEVHERDLDIDFSLVVIKHLLCQMTSRPDQTPLNFKLLLMSATFNTELFTNYFSKSSIAGVERVDAYKGVAERYKRMEQEKKDRLAAIWGPAKQSDWEYHTNAQPKSNKPSVSVKDDDEWVEDRGQHRHVMPVAQSDDPAEIVEINARPFKVTEFYIDKILNNLKSEKRIKLSAQDTELLHEAFEHSHSDKPCIKEGVMRVAAFIICDIIERLNVFEDEIAGEGEEVEKMSILVFLPGYHEIFEFMEYLKHFYDENFLLNKIELIPLHSSLSQEE